MGLADGKDAVVAFIREHIALAEPAVLFIGFAEGVPGLSVLVPSSPLFLGIGAAHGAAGGSFWHLWLAGSIGAVISDCLVYLAGRHLEDRVAHLPAFMRHPRWLPRAHTFFERWGMLAVLGGKFAGPMRPFIPAVAGIAGMPFWTFLPASIVSSCAWTAAFLAPGYGIRFLID